MPPRIDLTGKQFGYWTVLHYAYEDHAKWNCRCVCGVVKSVRADHLKSGASTNCGCVANREGRSKKLQTHSSYQTPEYHAWSNLRERCLNPRCHTYKHYGGRGITVCDRWRDSFENFLSDMGSRPSDDHSIDRIDNDGPYSPENCRWATISVQRKNQRPRTALTANGVTMTVTQWARYLGVTTQTIYLRLKRMPVEQALTMERQSWQHGHVKRYRLGKDNLTVEEWAKRLDLTPGAVNYRLARMPLKEALSLPRRKKPDA